MESNGWFRRLVGTRIKESGRFVVTTAQFQWVPLVVLNHCKDRSRRDMKNIDRKEGRKLDANKFGLYNIEIIIILFS